MSEEKQRLEAQRWFKQSCFDLDTAKILLENHKFASCCFWAHQASEKALKAVWYYLDEEPWGHSLRI